MRKVRIPVRAAALIVIVTLALTVPASIASAAVLGTDLFTITVTNGSQTGFWHLPVSGNFVPGDVWTYDLASPVSIKDSSQNVVATLSTLHLEVDQDPAVSLFFSVENPNNATMHVTANSPVVAVAPPLTNVTAFASSSMTLTDSNHDGASETGNFSAAKAYRSIYNSSNIFMDLIAPFTAPNDGGQTSNDRYPLVPPTRSPIAGTVTDISSRFDFNLSPFDQASGTSRFDVTGDIVPEPAALSLLGFGAGTLLLNRRRRVA